MDETYAVRVLDALSDEHPTAVRYHDGVHLLELSNDQAEPG